MKDKNQPASTKLQSKKEGRSKRLNKNKKKEREEEEEEEEEEIDDDDDDVGKRRRRRRIRRKEKERKKEMGCLRGKTGNVQPWMWTTTQAFPLSFSSQRAIFQRHLFNAPLSNASHAAVSYALKCQRQSNQIAIKRRFDPSRLFTRSAVIYLNSGPDSSSYIHCLDWLIITWRRGLEATKIFNLVQRPLH